MQDIKLAQKTPGAKISALKVLYGLGVGVAQISRSAATAPARDRRIFFRSNHVF
jgi:hypothetical protein